ncbi:MAG: methyltransferase [Planctomycetales bacterium]
MNRARRPPRARDDSGPPPVRPAERLLIEAVPELDAERIVCTSAGRAQFAAEAARQLSGGRVTCLYLDLHQAEQARRLQAEIANLSIVCQSDLPEEEVDAVALPFLKNGEAELARELIQQGLLRLRAGGRMLCASDDPRDAWLHDELRSLFPKVTRRPARDGVLYLATKRDAPKKIKSFLAEFKFRDGERLVEVVSRPGVFSHRRVDPGARAVLERMDVGAGEKVFDIGCGSGVLTLAAAQRAPDVRVFAVDSNPRAVECTLEGVRRNGLENVAVRLDAQAACDEPGSCDLVVANPPYFSNYRIAEIFLRGAHAALKPEGRLLVVTKRPEWYVEWLMPAFRELTVAEVRRYAVIRAAGPTVGGDPHRSAARNSGPRGRRR